VTLLDQIRARLSASSETPGLDAQVLLAAVTGNRRAWALAHPQASLTDEQTAALEAALLRLEGGEPLPYVLGKWEFYGLEFTLSPATLIPRPETELLVEQALGWLRAHPGRRWAADVGTGSGCIAVALAVHIPDLKVLASDLSIEALQLAADNVSRHGVQERIRLIRADLLPPVAQRFDLICANLPYIPSEKLAGLKVSQREPLLALDGGPDGLDLIRRLLKLAPESLAPGGALLMEIEASQGPAAGELARAALPSAAVEVIPDLAGYDRLVKVQDCRSA
jgi:release factor glutamine methyltransferase